MRGYGKKWLQILSFLRGAAPRELYFFLQPPNHTSINGINFFWLFVRYILFLDKGPASSSSPTGGTNLCLFLNFKYLNTGFGVLGRCDNTV